MSITVNMRELLQAEFILVTKPVIGILKLAPYLFGARNKIHIINLEHTVPAFNSALEFVEKLSSGKNKLLLLGQKELQVVLLSKKLSDVACLM